MADQTVDYSALADQARKQAGQTIDFSGLADQARKQAQTTGVTLPGSASDYSLSNVVGNPIQRFGSAYAEGMNPIPPAGSLQQSPMGPMVNPDVVNNVVNQMSSKAQEAGQAFKQGNYGRGVLSSAEALPLVGPVVSNIEQKVRGGDVAGLAGTGASLATPYALGKVSGLGTAARQGAAESLYGSALKPSTTLPVNTRRALINTGLREGIPVSEAGFNQAVNTTDALNNQIAAKIAQRSQELGPVINPGDVANRVEQVRPTFANQVNPASDLSALDRSKAEFLAKHTPEAPESPTLYGPNGKPLPAPPPPEPTPMTLAEAQSEKQGTYRQLRKKYGELGNADVEGQKALARGLKEEVVNQYPELSALNERDSEMIALEQSLARFVGRYGNKNVLGLVPAVMGASSGMPLVKMLTAAALDNPAIKSRLAIALSKTAKPMSVSPIVSAGQAANIATQQSTAQPQMAKGGVVSSGASVEDRVRGSANVPLSPVGVQEALDLGKHMVKNGFGRRGDTITSGILDRSKQTAALIAKSAPGARMMPPDESLDTWHLGAIEGQPSDQVAGQIEQLIKNPDMVPPPGQVSSQPPESLNQFKQRALPPWKARYQAYLRNPNSRHLFISHGRGARLLQAWVKKGMPDNLDLDGNELLREDDKPADVWRLAPGNGGVPKMQEIDRNSTARIKQGLFLVRHASTPWNQPHEHPDAMWKKGGVVKPPTSSKGLQAVAPLS